MRLRVAVVAAASALIGAAGTAAASEPILPLSQVRPGMACTVLSVVRGTEIASFDATVQDVVAGDAAARQPYLLVSLSGAAIDRTGVGPGFSGSPVMCPDADGIARVAGAISEGIGEYGGKTVLATPIESVLAEPVDPPAQTRVRASLVARARPLGTPLSVSGLSPAVMRSVQQAAARVHRVVYATPAAPRPADFAPVVMQPGASLGVSMASGDISAGSIGTVTYVDGDKLWGFGHPMDSVGRRSLFLQDAYVYTVVNNPVAADDLHTYKYAAFGHDVGMLTWDGMNAVTGRLGVLPRRFPLKVVARDLDRGTTQVANVQVADEGAIGQPMGTSPLMTVAPMAVAQMAYTALGSSPSRQSGSMCMRIGVRARAKPLRFCNTYVGGAPGAAGVAGGPIVADVAAATGLLDAFRFGPLDITGVEVAVKLRRSLRHAYIVGATGPEVVRRGRTARIAVKVRRVDGATTTQILRVPVARSAQRGHRAIVLAGTAADISGPAGDALESVLDLGSLTDASPADDAGPRTMADLAKAVADLHRPDGLTAALVSPDRADSDTQPEGRQVLAGDPLRVSGTAVVPLVVR